ncbi:hypothetical protein QN219_06380 [Sinorhizobium sp. 7-81]|uniref:hypothetical protein n=1 Tax=Sinorhizobium sp. 8-89 TaxID=3049089 RepID=UPI0024C2C38A|nr:hypothetical protein [Sinorhizobium sp. 8-89]MDK1489684.1 hypothetical protein [Sinorhizobium sp. 8-89]
MNYRTLTNGLTLADALRLSEKQAAEEEKRRAAQRQNPLVVERIKQMEREREEMMRMREAVLRRAEARGGFKGIVARPAYAFGTGFVEGLGPAGELATWTGEQAAAYADALANATDAAANYQEIKAFRQEAQRDHPHATTAGGLSGAFVKERFIPPAAGIALDVGAGGVMGGIENGWTPENVRRGAEQAAAEALATHYVAKPFGKAAKALGFAKDSKNLDAAISVGSGVLVDGGSAAGRAIWEKAGRGGPRNYQNLNPMGDFTGDYLGDDRPSPSRFRR